MFRNASMPRYFSLFLWLKRFSKKVSGIASFISCLLFPGGEIASADNNGLIGGESGSKPLALLIAPDGTLTPVDIPASVPSGFIQSVAINSSGIGLIGGKNTAGKQPPIAFFVAPDGTTSGNLVPSSIISGEIYSVAINFSGTGLIGGQNTTGPLPPIALFVAPDGTSTKVDFSTISSHGTIVSVAINDSGTGLLGGQNFLGSPIAVFAAPDGTPTSVIDFSSVPHGTITDVAINSSGTGLVGGRNLTNSTPFALLAASNGAVTNLNPLPSMSSIGSVAINDSGVGLIGGVDTSTSPSIPLAFFVDSHGNLTPISFTTSGTITSVAINSSGTGLLGGADKSVSPSIPLAFFVDSHGNLTSISITTPSTINSVEINSSGAGLLGGVDTADFPIAFLVAPNGDPTPLNLSSFQSGSIGSVDLTSLLVSALSKIPTGGLHGNNLTLANYINNNASSEAFYFVPAFVDGTLNLALESVAPTRNAFSLLTADNNLFVLNFSLARHSQDSRQYRRYANGAFSHRGGAEGSLSSLLLSGAIPDCIATTRVNTSCELQTESFISEMQANNQQVNLGKASTAKAAIGPYALWGEIIGAFSSQKAQHQTPGFDPATGGLILAFEATAIEQVRVGGGAAYVYTHLHEKENAGHSSINQEYLFAYSLWSNYDLYCDAALWGGLFQIANVRDIHMTGFDFQSKAHPNGWQLGPHFELGYDYDFWKQMFMLEPFVLFDWVNNWQGRYKETGSGPFNFEQKSHYSSFLRSETGLRFYERIDFHSWRLILKEKVGYVNKKPFGVGSVTAFLVGFPGSLTVETFSTTQNLAAVEMEFLFEPADPHYPYGSVSYMGEFCPAYQSNQVSLNVSWSF